MADDGAKFIEAYTLAELWAARSDYRARGDDAGVEIIESYLANVSTERHEVCAGVGCGACRWTGHAEEVVGRG